MGYMGEAGSAAGGAGFGSIKPLSPTPGECGCRVERTGTDGTVYILHGRSDINERFMHCHRHSEVHIVELEAELAQVGSNYSKIRDQLNEKDAQVESLKVQLDQAHQQWAACERINEKLHEELDQALKEKGEL